MARGLGAAHAEKMRLKAQRRDSWYATYQRYYAAPHNHDAVRAMQFSSIYVRRPSGSIAGGPHEHKREIERRARRGW